MQNCPHCGKQNADGDAYCYSCGHILLSALQYDGATGKLQEVYESLEPRRRWGTAYFDRRNQLQLLFRDTNQTLILEVTGEIVLGRFHNEPGVSVPDVDLTPFEALDKGVSRNHMSLRRDQDTVMVTDLGSANNTFLNGQRLMPYEGRILRDNDELRLGHLVIRVSFV